MPRTDYGLSALEKRPQDDTVMRDGTRNASVGYVIGGWGVQRRRLNEMFHVWKSGINATVLDIERKNDD